MLLVGEGYAGDSRDYAHVNVVLGDREGSMAGAFAAALSSLSAGHVPFLACVQPNVAARPITVLVSKAAFAGERHKLLTWGAAHAGVAEAIARAGVERPHLADLLCIASVWVPPEAEDEEAVYENNRAAAELALARAEAGEPTREEVVRALEAPGNGFFRQGLSPERP